MIIMLLVLLLVLLLLLLMMMLHSGKWWRYAYAAAAATSASASAAGDDDDDNHNFMLEWARTSQTCVSHVVCALAAAAPSESDRSSSRSCQPNGSISVWRMGAIDRRGRGRAGDKREEGGNSKMGSITSIAVKQKQQRLSGERRRRHHHHHKHDASNRQHGWGRWTTTPHKYRWLHLFEYVQSQSSSSSSIFECMTWPKSIQKLTLNSAMS